MLQWSWHGMPSSHPISKATQFVRRRMSSRRQVSAERSVMPIRRPKPSPPPHPSREHFGRSQGPGDVSTAGPIWSNPKKLAKGLGLSSIQSCRTKITKISTYKHLPYLDYRGFVSGLIGIKYLKHTDMYGRLWKIIATNTKPSARMRDTTKNDRHFT